MGADLVGYFAKGPRKLPEGAIPAAIAQAERGLTWLRHAQDVLEDSAHAGWIELLHDCPWADSDSLECNPQSIDQEQLEHEFRGLLDLAGDIDGLTGEQVVREFIDSWPPEFRDSAHVVDPDCPDKFIVFAGERTWGDTPDGLGFQMLRRAGLLGIAPILGVWVETAFITIDMSSLLKGNQHDD